MQTNAIFDVNKDKYPADLFRFNSASKVFILGSSNSGKSTTVCQFLRNLDQYWTGPTPRILYCYNSEGPQNLPSDAKTFSGLPPLSEVIELAKADERSLVVIYDDLIPAFNNLSGKEINDYSGFLVDISRKVNCSIFVISQFIYTNGQFLKHFIRAATAFMMFTYSQDLISLSRFIGQIFYGQRPYFLESLRHSLKQGFAGYIFVPLMRTHPEQRLVHNIRNFMSVPKNKALANGVYTEGKSFFYEPQQEAIGEALMPRKKPKGRKDGRVIKAHFASNNNNA